MLLWSVPLLRTQSRIKNGACVGHISRGCDMKRAGKRILRTVQLRGGECARTEGELGNTFRGGAGNTWSSRVHSERGLLLRRGETGIYALCRGASGVSPTADGAMARYACLSGVPLAASLRAQGWDRNLESPWDTCTGGTQPAQFLD